MGLIDSSNDPASQDMKAAMSGTNVFMDRINQLANARMAAEDAIKELEAKGEIKSTLDQAEQVLAKAKTDSDLLLNIGRKDAMKIVDEARSQSAQMRNDAQAWSEKTKAEANQLLNEAKAHSEQMVSDAKQMLKDAQDAKAEADRIKANADAIVADAVAKAKAADVAIDEANKKAEAADALVARVKAAITG